MLAEVGLGSEDSLAGAGITRWHGGVTRAWSLLLFVILNCWWSHMLIAKYKWGWHNAAITVWYTGSQICSEWHGYCHLGSLEPDRTEITKHLYNLPCEFNWELLDMSVPSSLCSECSMLASPEFKADPNVIGLLVRILTARHGILHYHGQTGKLSMYLW